MRTEDASIRDLLTDEELAVIRREAARLGIGPLNLIIRWLVAGTHEVCRREAIERGDEP